MIDRYKDKTIDRIFSDEDKWLRWRSIELNYLSARMATGDPLVTRELIDDAASVALPTAEQLSDAEEEVGHDVVAFLLVWTRAMQPATQAQIHLGLTSSDLVDNALFSKLQRAGKHVYVSLLELDSQLRSWSFAYRNVKRAGRTHGQLAEPTTMGWRFQVWSATLSMLIGQWSSVADAVGVMKTPGATGNMRLLGEATAVEAAGYLGVELVPSTQVIPRQRVMVWAGWLLLVASLVEEVALEIRLSARSEVGEMTEGADRVGSSAMPHKKNPIGSEQLSGLARVARSHFAAIAETAGALHNERDISNSSVERLVVPDLAHIVSYMVGGLTRILNALHVDLDIVESNANEIIDSAEAQYRLQREGVPYIEAARRVARGLDKDEPPR